MGPNALSPLSASGEGAGGVRRLQALDSASHSASLPHRKRSALTLSRIWITLALATFVLWRNLPRALLFLWPGLARARKLDDTSPLVDFGLFEELEQVVSPLGFAPLGAHAEVHPLRRPTATYDFALRGEPVWGSAWRQGPEIRFALITAFQGGGMVLTADHQRPGIDRPPYLAGGLPEASLEQLLAAHRRRVDRLRQLGFSPLADLSLDSRVGAARAFYRGPGAREVRLGAANAFILSSMALVLFGAALVAVARAW